MEYIEGMEKISSGIMEKVLSAIDNYDYNKYTGFDVKRALKQPDMQYRRL